MNRLAAIALFAAALFFTFHRLGSGSLAPWDESLTAERSREMLASGDWLTPQLGFEPNFQKPPLYYWITATLFRAIGQDEFSVRLTSACFGLGCVVLVFLLGRGAGGPGCGLLCAAALALNPHWMFLTRQGMLDSGMAFGLLGCTWALTRPGPRPGAAGFFLALGCLIKTPLVLAGLVIPAFERLAVRREPGARRDIVIAALVACVAGLWWYLFAVVRWGNAFWQTFFVYNTWMRMTETVEGHANSPTFYPTMILQHAPVCFGLFVVALIVALTCRAIARKHATFLLASVIG
ncbi:MAG TPA: glycosyltransferase family 39 protein, partial [Kiritimatiellia bacterium]